MAITILRREEGAVAVLVGILMVALILCVALVVDLGHLHNVKIQLQRAADASALAGAMQLDGSDQATHPEAVAWATARANKVDAIDDGSWADDTNFDVELGIWDPLLSADPRYTPVGPGAEDTANAIKVTATLEVDHFFFVFIPGMTSTTITADAIAVNKHEETALPIALLSCIPINEGISLNVCGIELYKFNNDTDDTAGWTALTYDINAAQLKYFFTEEGNAIVNEILYGNGDGEHGLENFTVMEGNSTYDPSIPCGAKNVEIDIRCGLGPALDPKEDPLPSTDDPLFGYGQIVNSLPRWDSVAFERVWSMDGILKQGYVAGENSAQYTARLKALYTGSNTDVWTAYDTNYPTPLLPSWARDGRFTRLVDDKKFFAIFDEALRYAGYPEIRAKNGADNSVLQQFIDMSTDGDHFKSSLTAVNPPLDEEDSTTPHISYGGGDTFAVTIPVIFAGTCGEWKALKGKFYIGTANLLITRIWKNKNDCVDASAPVTIWGGGPACSPGWPTPLLDNDTYACVTGSDAGIEALITPRGEEGPSGVQKIFLVE